MPRSTSAMRTTVAVLLAAAASASVLTATPPARADGGHRSLGSMPMLKAYVQECSSCHVPYAPGLLPAESWQRVMGSLDRHYGSDATLDAATTRQIAVWLEAHAGPLKRFGAAPAQDRITRSAWFVREHRKVDAAVWSHPAVGSAANCAACHRDADLGVFDERSLRAPPGLPARLRRGHDD